MLSRARGLRTMLCDPSLDIKENSAENTAFGVAPAEFVHSALALRGQNVRILQAALPAGESPATSITSVAPRCAQQRKEAMRSELVVLGGGPGGYAAAFLAADLGIQVTLVNAESRLGGVCLLRGCIPSKALLHVAKVMSEARELAVWGIEFPPPSINLDALRAAKNGVIETLTGGLDQLAKRRNVQVLHARGRFTGSQELRLEPLGGQAGQADQLSFEHCILAVGSSPVIPPPLRIDSRRVTDSTGALELNDIPERLLVVGGGYIGLEMGSVYAELGTRVTVVELTDGLLPGVDRDLVRPLAARLAKRFDRILLNTKVGKLAERGNLIEATLESPGGEATQETFDRVLVAVGRRPNSAGLGLETTQAKIDARGFVVVDQKQRTADPHLLAIGDVAGEPMLAHKATHEGKVAVEGLSGGPAEFDARAIPAVVFTDPEIAWAGLTEADAKRGGRHITVARYPWAANGRAQSLHRTDGLTKLLIESGTDRVLGAGIVGSGAGDMIAEVVLAIEMGCTVRDLTESIHPHPTLGETIPAAGEVHLGLATEIYRPKRKPATA